MDLVTGAAGAGAPLWVRGGFQIKIAGGVNRRSFLYPLTLAGSQSLPVRSGDALERAATALLAELIERTVPL